MPLCHARQLLSSRVHRARLRSPQTTGPERNPVAQACPRMVVIPEQLTGDDSLAAIRAGTHPGNQRGDDPADRWGGSERAARSVITRWWTAPIRVKAMAWVSVPDATRPAFSAASR